MCLLPLLLLSILLCLPVSSQVILSPEAISISAWVATDRSCVAGCVDMVGPHVGCSANSCLCRSDVMTSGESWLSTCIANNECGAPDISDATTRYSEYCSAYTAELQGQPASIPAATTTTAATVSNGGTLSTTASTITNPFSTGPAETGSSSSPASSGSSQSQSSSCTVGSLSCGGVGGIVAACLALLGVGGFKLYSKKFRNSNNNNFHFHNGDIFNGRIP